MSTQTCTIEIDTHLFDMLDNINTFGPYAGSSLGTNHHSPFGFGLLNFDQTITSMQFPSQGQFQTSGIEPSLVLPPPAIYNGNMLSAYWTASFPIADINSSANLDSSSVQSSPRTAETLLPTLPTKRRTRRKKAPLPPAVKEEKRVIFLEKNRKAASKCRERNKRQWDLIQKQCIELEAQNRVLKEQLVELKIKVKRLTKLVKEHRGCRWRK
jgi:hypothetical protein